MNICKDIKYSWVKTNQIKEYTIININVIKLFDLNLLMHSLTYVMKQSRPKKKASPITNSKKQPQRNIIYTNQDIAQQDSIKFKRKFIQQSVFLPVINKKTVSQRKGHERWYSQGDEKWKAQQDSDSQTMQYIYQCDEIISNLRKITRNSNQKIRFRDSLSRQAYLNNRDLIMNANNRNIRSQNTDNYKNQRLKEELQELARRKKENTNNVQNNSNKQQNNQKQKQKQLTKDDKKQKILVKFLNKAKNRGFQLHKKIIEFRQRKVQLLKKTQYNPQNQSTQINNQIK